MKTLAGLLDELKLTDALDLMAAAVPVESYYSTLSLHVPPAILDGVAGVKARLFGSGGGDYSVTLSLDAAVGRLRVSLLASRPATAEDALALVLMRDVKPAVAPAREVRACDETAGAAMAGVG